MTIGVEPVWNDDHAHPIGITYEITASATNQPNTDGSTGVTPGVAIAPNTGKITITDAAVVDNSGDYTVTATVTAGLNSNYVANTATSTTVTVTIAPKPNLNTVALSYAEVTTTAGTANDTGVTPRMGCKFRPSSRGSLHPYCLHPQRAHN